MLKRSGFKPKTFEEKLAKAQKAYHWIKYPKTVKRKVKLKKVSKQPISRLKNKLWELCKQIVRILYKQPNGTWVCYTCGRIIDEPAKAQTGHFLASSVCGAYLRHDLRNLRIQDYYCNINLGGNGATFYKNMVEREGQGYVDQLFLDKQKIIKADAFFYEQKISEYEKILEKLSTPT